MFDHMQPQDEGEDETEDFLGKIIPVSTIDVLDSCTGLVCGHCERWDSEDRYLL